jgi:hypothetical protein
MANQYFQFYRGNEFTTYNKIVNEMVEMYGVQAYYLPKTNVALDFFYGEDPLMKFENKYEMTIYVLNTGGWEGQGDMYAKFGFELNDEASFAIQIDQFKVYTGLERPMISDLLYLPWQKDKMIMEISHVDMESSFYHLGQVSTYTIKAKRFKYSKESITALVDDEELTIDINAIIANNDNMDDAPHIQNEDSEDNVIDNSEADPFGS